MRILAATAVAVIGYVGVAHAFAQSIARRDPSAAYAIAPFDGRITAQLAALLADDPNASMLQRARSERLARTALRQDPTAVLAISTLGVNALAHNEVTTARRMFTRALTFSRRDIHAQLWAIEDDVARGDVAGALRHYDLALRTNDRLSEVLMPILATATAQPAVRAGLVRTLAGRPLWGDGFLTFLGTHSPDPQSLAAFLTQLRVARVPIPESAEAAAVDGLIGAGLPDQAWTHYATLRPGVERTRSRDPRFAATIVSPTVLDWVTVGVDGAETAITNGAFDFAVPASVGGVLLRQTQLFGPGRYQLAGQSSGLQQPHGSQPYWLLACGDQREIGRLDMPNSAEGGGRFIGEFRVPASCPIQTLSLVARSSEAVTGVSGRLEGVELRKLGGRE